MKASERPPIDRIDVETLRQDEFAELVDGGTVYVNSAATGPLPERTRRAMAEFARHRASPGSISDEDLHRLAEDVRGACGRLINARSSEIALGANTTFGLNLAAGGLDLGPGHRVLLLDGEFPGNVYPWLNLRRRGVAVEFVPRDDSGLPNVDAALERIGTGDITAFAVSAVSFYSGCRIDLDLVSRTCRAHDTLLVVDAIQAVGAVPFDLAETPVDILACGGQKWLLSPWGSGFAYVREELLERLQPAVVGWTGFVPAHGFDDLLDYRFERLPRAAGFELGTLGYSALAGFSQSLSLLLDLGIDRIHAHTTRVQQPLIDWAANRQDVELLSDANPRDRSGILAFRCARPAHVVERLRARNVIASCREGAVRVAPHLFNTAAEMRRIAEIAAAALQD